MHRWVHVQKFWGVVSVFVVACASPDPIFVERRVEVVAPRSCAPGQPIEETVGPIEVLALGDFPLSDEGVENVTPTAPTTLERFPTATELVVARTQSDEWSAWGAREVSDAGASPLVLAPMGGACPLTGDFELRAASGAALASLNDGGALVVGGLASDRGFEGSRRLIRLPPDLSLSEVLPSQLSLGRLGATATETNGRVVIAGGARFEDERALDTFDVFDTRSGELAFRDRPLCAASDATCIGRRRDHGAGRLADGRVLLFGGVMRAGGANLREEILDTGVIVDANAGEVDLVIDSDLGDGETVPARRLPHVVTLDSAETYVVGGQGEGGGWTPTVYRFDAERNGFDRVTTLESDGSRDRFVVPPEPGVALALPGSRIAYVTDGPRFTVLLFDGPTVVRRVEPTVISSDFTGTVTGVRALALPDGALFLTGADADSGAPLAFRVDLGEGVATRVDPPMRVPEHLLALHHGAVLSVDAEGGSYHRIAHRTPFDNPPTTLLPTDREWLTYDAAPGWSVGASGATANRSARVALGGLRLRDFSFRLVATAGVDVELVTETGTAATVRLRDGSVESGLCRVAWSGGAVTILREGTQLTLIADDEGICTIPNMLGRVSLQMQVAVFAEFRSIQLQRR